MIKNAKGIALVCIAALAPNSASAAEWVMVAQSVGSKVAFYVDVSQIRINSAGYRVYWRKIEYATPKPDSGKFVKEAMFRAEADCTDRRSRGLTLVYYYTNGSNRSWSATGDWEYVAPESMNESELDFVCSLAL